MFGTRTRLALAAAVSALLVAPLVLVAPAASARHGDRFPARIELPDGFQPEGIAIGRGPRAWLGSLADGDIYQVDLRTGAGRTISQGPGTPSVGMKVDGRGRLFVAGGTAGDARVIDSRSGEVLASYPLTTGGFVNDVVLTRHAAYLTDSFQPQLYRLPLGPGGALPDPADVETVRLTGQWQQGVGFGANGIARSPDRTALLVVHSIDGLLYRVDPATGEAAEVDLGGALLTTGDGLLTHDRVLFAVLNQQNRVAVVRLDRSGRSGVLRRFIVSDGFDVPTTVAKFSRGLYLPNARFGTAPPASDTAYWVTRVPTWR